MDHEPLTVPVGALCQGLYVHELDRPWLETPFLFQGFRIESDEDLETLRSHCRHVKVDPDRSDPEALAEAQKLMTRSPAPRQGGDELPQRSRTVSERDRVEAFGNRAFPDRARFRDMVRVAHDARAGARSAIDSALGDTRLGHAVDLPSLRTAVGNMTHAVIGNASAALWLTALKNVSEYTAIHCINVCVLSLAFGRHLGLSARDLRSIALGALLHDVGKARTPQEILDKPGPLTKEEFQTIQRHPEDGYRMVSEAGHVSQVALDIIRLHHERLDGSGYVMGLEGERIPQHVRIVAIADIYDAMTSDRAYSGARSPDEALKEIHEQRGTSLDESLASQFIRCIGIFPVGSLVELDTGALGLVVASSANAHLQPTILMLRTPDGAPYEKRLLINLAATDEELGTIGHRIARGVDPTDAGVDIAQIVGAEFGLGAA